MNELVKVSYKDKERLVHVGLSEELLNLSQLQVVRFNEVLSKFDNGLELAGSVAERTAIFFDQELALNDVDFNFTRLTSHYEAWDIRNKLEVWEESQRFLRQLEQFVQQNGVRMHIIEIDFGWREKTEDQFRHVATGLHSSRQISGVNY